ncbi:MAG: hypothetical protein K0U41_06375 [Gammaproteobacteria bacterium]|nr:hypothetical protein [Gammaproteobacteria bacterium]
MEPRETNKRSNTPIVYDQGDDFPMLENDSDMQDDWDDPNDILQDGEHIDDIIDRLCRVQTNY